MIDEEDPLINRSLKCLQCKREFLVDSIKYKYCPYCGAILKEIKKKCSKKLRKSRT